MNCSVSSNSPVVELAQALIKTPSITPQDLGCQEIIIKRLKAMGFKVYPLRFGVVENFYARLGNSGKNFCFAGHTDVVAPGDNSGWRSDPFAAEIKDGHLWGRGACDMKGAIASMVVAFEKFLKANPNFSKDNSLSFLITGDEEGDAVDGTVRVLDWLNDNNEKLDYCLVGEPTCVAKLGDCLKNGRRGSINGVINFQGKQGHVAYPHLADNPIHKASPALVKLTAIKFDEGDEHFPATSMQFTNIKAGDGSTNVVPGTLEAGFNIRFSPQNTPESLEKKIRAVLDDPDHPDYKLTLKLSGLPFLSQDGTLRSALDKSIKESLKHEAQSSTGGGTSDARFISQVCAQTIEFGLVGSSMHKLNEGVAIADLEELTQVYHRLLVNVFF
ncbi:MAG: succinyl-diaminopimelate desuccinylase [Magnetococcales bacterium]|nr:succinyl-diaminopimelate desuccinylase [Magnetococcales bacterium]